MATLIRTDGTETEIPTPNAKQIRELIGAELLVVARCHDGRSMFVNDEAVGRGLPINAKATALYRRGHVDPIHGDVVVFSLAETEGGGV